MEWFYLGLEAKLRDNKFPTLEEACKIAIHAANTLDLPIRVYMLKPDSTSCIIGKIYPGAMEDTIMEKWHTR